MTILRSVFVRTSHKQSRARSVVLQIEQLELRLVPTVMAAQQQQLTSYWADKMTDFKSSVVVQPPVVVQTPALTNQQVLDDLGDGGDMVNCTVEETKYQTPMECAL